MSKRNKYPFLESIDNEKWQELHDIAKEFESIDLNKTRKYILKNTSIKKKKNLLVILSAMLLESRSLNWNNVKKKIYELKKIPGLKKKNSSMDEKIEKNVELYINIGRDKKIFPPDLVNFIKQSMKIKHEQIQNIKIHDTYSFFRIPEDFADKAIILLSVKKFRGKKIAVHYAKKSQ